jgi:hypothetical protein
MTSTSRLSVATLSLSLGLLTGCTLATTAVDGPQAFVPMSGVVMGAQIPITGASIAMYDASVSSSGGANTYGGAPLELASGITSSVAGSQGSFTLTQYGTNVCLAGTDQLYIVSTGGNPGGGTNAAGTLVAALGSCSGINSSTQVFMNEATTIAAAYALSGFAYPDGDSINVGAPASNLTGLQHAMANALNLVSYNGQTRGVTVGGNGLVPTAVINTLANALSACVNSAGANGVGSTPCSPIEVAPPAAIATVTCFTTSCIPDNTWQVALQWALYPGFNVAAVYNNGGLYGSGFYVPNLAGTPPADLSIAIEYYAGYKSGTTTTNSPHDIKADGNGNIWVAGMTGNELSELGSDGTVKSPVAGFLPGANTQVAAAAGGDALFSLAIDNNNNPWAIDQGNQGATVPVAGYLWLYNITTSTGSSVMLPATANIGTGTVAFPPYGSAIGVDYNNNVWYGSFTTKTPNVNGFNEYLPGTSAFQTFPSTTLTTVDTYPTTNVGFNYLTVDASNHTNGNVFAGYQASFAAYFLPPYSAQPNYFATAAATSTDGSAIDGADNLWLVGEGGATDNGGYLYDLAMSNTANAPIRYAGPGSFSTTGALGLTKPACVAIDGIGRLFLGIQGSTKASNVQNGGIAEFDQVSSSFLMTKSGSIYAPYQPVDSTGTGILAEAGPLNITIDSAGAIWTINAGATSYRPVVQMLGPGAPTVAPLAAGKYGICTGAGCSTKDGRP